jgi:HSP20 family protein
MADLIPWRRTNGRRGELARSHDHPFARLREEFDSLFDHFLTRWSEPFGEQEFGRFWALDVEDQDKEFVVKAEVPGFDSNEIDLQVTGDTLTIKAEKKEEKKGKEGKFESQRYRAFQRTITLPPGTDANKIEARYKNGLLEVHVPKSEEAKAKRIPIKS